MANKKITIYYFDDKTHKLKKKKFKYATMKLTDAC